VINFINSFVLKDIKLNYGISMFSNVGDELIYPISEGGFSPHLYTRRHIICSGSFRIDWMVGGTALGLYHIFTEQDKEDLLVFPYKDQPCDAIKLTALEPNSSYLCVVPLLENENKIVDEQLDLVPNQPFTLTKGRLYISNIDLNINGNNNLALVPFACVYNEVTITPTSNGILASFYNIKKL
jgi:hypothetical protein